MATQELRLDLQDSDDLENPANGPDIKNFDVSVCTESNECSYPRDISNLSGSSSHDKYGVPRNQSGNLSIKVKEEVNVRSDIQQAGLTLEQSSMKNKSDTVGNPNAKSGKNSDFQTKTDQVNPGHATLMKVVYPLCEHISTFSHQKASGCKSEFQIEGEETLDNIPMCVDDGFGIQNRKCVDVLNVQVKEEADVKDIQQNVEFPAHSKTREENIPWTCVNVKPDFTSVERETGVRQSVHGDQCVIANSQSIAGPKSDVSVQKLVIQENPSEDKYNTRKDVSDDTCSNGTNENPQAFPIALHQVHVDLPVTEEIQQVHQECLREQKERNQIHQGEMEEKNEIESQSNGFQRRSLRKRNAYGKTDIIKKQVTEVRNFEQGKSFGVNLYQPWSKTVSQPDQGKARNIFQCKKCPKTFKFQSGLANHWKSVHANSTVKLFKCGLCKKGYSSLVNLRGHRLTKGHKEKVAEKKKLLQQCLESDQEKIGFVCGICDKSYKSRCTLRRHKVLHQEKPPTQQYACGECDKVFNTYYGLTRHKELHLALTYKCGMCTLTFRKRSYLKDHIKRIHLQKAKEHQENKICGKVLKCKKAFKQHMSIHKQPHVNALCEKCGKSFKHKYSLRYHMRSHSGERPYQCQYCEKTYTRSHYRDAHIAAVHNNQKPYHCEYCSRHFSYKVSLLCHVEAVHSDNPITICAHCGKCYNSEVALKRHQKTIMGLDSTQCEQCGKIVHKRSLNRHLKTHKNSDKKDTFNTNQTGLYVCALCRKPLKSKKARRYHMRVHLFEDFDV